MFLAAARALAALSASGPLLPHVAQLRQVAIAVAGAVARQAMIDGVAPALDAETLDLRIGERIWDPVYREYRRKIP
jgi:malate dehydrogenase (oxaloacetate-decarboxylating)